MNNIIRGGQISLHSIRMSLQLLMTLLKWVVLITLISAIFYIFGKFDLYDLKALMIYYLAKVGAGVGLEKHVFEIMNRAGSLARMEAREIVGSIPMILLKNRFFQTVFDGLLYGFLSSILVISGIIIIFKIKGKKIGKEKFLRGGSIVSAAKLKRIIQFENLLESKNPFKVQYHIANIPYPKDAEFLHTIVIGSTGTGKTNAILELIDQIRKNGERAIIYDKMGTYTALYYNALKDTILNPLDGRSKSWSMFNEIKRDSDFDYLAAALIQDKKGSTDPFWMESARRVLSVFARETLAENPNITNAEFVNSLLKADYKKIAKALVGTEATSLINKDSEKTALSILAVLSTYISSMKYLHDDNEKFSISKWIENENERGFLFISSKGDQHDSLKPLISAWMDVAVKSLLSLEQKEGRRIWIILDELPSLQQLPSLLDGLGQSRQFGGAFVLALHSISQLKTIYGKDATDTVISLCRNKLFFAVPDTEAADFCSENLGSKEVEEVKEGISYGANEIRDGVNLNKQKSTKKLVIPSELMLMAKLKAYLKFAGPFPIAQVKFMIKNRAKISLRFVERLTIKAPDLQEAEIIVENEEISLPTNEEIKEKKSFNILDENF